MSTRTVKSEEARIKMRDLLDEVSTGGEVIIERYNKPVGVIIPHALWQRFKKLQREEIARIRQEMDQGAYETWDDVKARLHAEGILP